MQTSLQAFDRRLDPSSRAPLAVAFSGGGDSLALLLLTKAWAERTGRPVLALTVDHSLQPQSAAWTLQAEHTARDLGVDFRALRWEGEKPRSGLPAAARAARHRLTAEAARAAGASVILVGHTLDDQMENALMRQAGEPVGPLREWSPSPVWPQGRGLFHFRPLLTTRRADLRAWLSVSGAPGWIEDPANDDSRHARARARTRLGGGEHAPSLEAPDDDEALRVLALSALTPPWGAVVLPRAPLATARPAAALRLLQIAAVCVSGRQALGRPERARTILRRLTAGERFVASLGGARLTAGDDLSIVREAGEFARGGGGGALSLQAAGSTVWDGRFEIFTDRDGLAVQPLSGLAARLAPEEKAALRAIPAPARAALPTIMGGGGAPTCPILAGSCARGGGVRLNGLVAGRFAVACGLSVREDKTGIIPHMADWVPPSYVGSEG